VPATVNHRWQGASGRILRAFTPQPFPPEASWGLPRALAKWGSGKDLSVHPERVRREKQIIAQLA
jgi:hypothetical protein